MKCAENEINDTKINNDYVKKKDETSNETVNENFTQSINSNEKLLRNKLSTCILNEDSNNQVEKNSDNELNDEFKKKSKCIFNNNKFFEDITFDSEHNIYYENYESELQMSEIISLIQKDLSEPYSIYTYRYFIYNWPKLCFLAFYEKKIVGAIVCKIGFYKNTLMRGYIAMLAVNKDFRRKKIGSNLVKKAINAMQMMEADEIVLETEVTNKYALKLYENLGFVGAKRLFRYYLNGEDALRLKLWLKV